MKIIFTVVAVVIAIIASFVGLNHYMTVPLSDSTVKEFSARSECHDRRVRSELAGGFPISRISTNIIGISCDTANRAVIETARQLGALEK